VCKKDEEKEEKEQKKKKREMKKAAREEEKWHKALVRKTKKAENQATEKRSVKPTSTAVTMCNS